MTLMLKIVSFSFGGTVKNKLLKKTTNPLNEKYDIIKKIGEGGHSIIYLVKDKKKPTEKYAAKVIHTVDEEIELAVEIHLPKS